MISQPVSELGIFNVWFDALMPHAGLMALGLKKSAWYQHVQYTTGMRHAATVNEQ
jgi:hypothetical protein